MSRAKDRRYTVEIREGWKWLYVRIMAEAPRRLSATKRIRIDSDAFDEMCAFIADEMLDGEDWK